MNMKKKILNKIYMLIGIVGFGFVGKATTLFSVDDNYYSFDFQ